MPNDKDELLLELMEHYYEEDERRNELIDSKNSQMIVLTGTILSLQVTLFTNLFVTQILTSKIICLYWKNWLAMIMMGSFISLAISMGIFIWAYAFQNDYLMVPDPKSLLKFNEQFIVYKLDVINKLLKSFDGAIDWNEDLMNSKVKKGNGDFVF